MVIEVVELCEKVLKGQVLDVFYLVMNATEISRKEIHQAFKDSAGIKSPSSQSYRFKIDEALAILESILFIESRREGTFTYFYLSRYGEYAKNILAELLDRDPTNVLRGSKVVSRVALDVDG